MPFKCCVFGCDGNYDSSDEKVGVFRFPTEENERDQWIRRLPNDKFIYNQNKRICSRHWPKDFSAKKAKGGALVPTEPPSVFPDDIPPSCIPTPSPPKRHAPTPRNVYADEISDFDKQDLICENDLIQRLRRDYRDKMIIAESKDKILIESYERDGPIPKYQLHLFPQLTNGFSLGYSAFWGLKQFKSPVIKSISRYSHLEELLRSCRNYESESQEKDQERAQFLNRQVHLMNSKFNRSDIHSAIYEPDDLTLGLEWCARSRSMYRRLRSKLHLPSISTIQRLVGKINKQTNESEVEFLRKVFTAGENRSRFIILLVDEVYVKPSLRYHGGKLFGRSEDTGELAKTVLGVMVKFLFSSKKLLLRAIPFSKLTARHQFDIVKSVCDNVCAAGGVVIATITDNNKVNQNYMTLFTHPDEARPWLAKSPTTDSTDYPFFLLYDSVHVFKNIRNNFITEKMKQLKFYDLEVKTEHIADWTHLKTLQKHEEGSFLKLSNLSKSAVAPTSIEKQKVSLVQKVFCDQTIAALKSCTATKFCSSDTVLFISYITRLWKVWNVKTISQASRFKDSDKSCITTTNCAQIEFLAQMAQLAKYMAPVSTSLRMKSLTQDTSNALWHTCQAFIELAKYLLTCEGDLRHDFLCLGYWQSDAIEEHFAHLRSCAGSCYYISVAQVMETYRIDVARFVTKHVPWEVFSSGPPHSAEHSCNECTAEISDDEWDFLDTIDGVSLSEEEDIWLPIVHIAGYIAFKHPKFRVSPDSVANDPRYQLIVEMDRGGLSYPQDALVSFVSFCYAYFNRFRSNTCCRKHVSRVFVTIDNCYFDSSFGRACKIITNIMFNDFSKFINDKLKQAADAAKLAKLRGSK